MSWRYGVLVAVMVILFSVVFMCAQNASASDEGEDESKSEELTVGNSTIESSSENATVESLCSKWAPPPERFALIIVSNLTSIDQNEISKATSLYQYLLGQGWEDDNIDVLGPDDIASSEGIANISNVEAGFNDLIYSGPTNKEVLIYISDHGWGDSETGFNLTFTDGDITSETIDSWIDQMSFSELTFIMNGNHSGLAGPAFCGPAKDIICSMGDTDEFSPDQFNITRGLTNPKADINKDGKVTFEEAYYSERAYLIRNTDQVPELW